LPGNFDEPFAESFIPIQICEDLPGDGVYAVRRICGGGIY